MDAEIEARFISVEQQVNTLRGIALQHLAHNREVDEHLTILLGVVKAQGTDISAMKADLSSVKESLAQVELQLVRLEDRFTRLETRMDARFDAILALLQGKPPSS